MASFSGYMNAIECDYKTSSHRQLMYRVSTYIVYPYALKKRNR